MKDETNPNIEYKQISILFILLFVVFIALLIMAVAFASLTLYTYIHGQVSEGKDEMIKIILFSLLDAFLIYSLTINFIIVFKAYNLKLDEHPILYLVFLYTSLNIPCAILMTKSLKKEEIE